MNSLNRLFFKVGLLWVMILPWVPAHADSQFWQRLGDGLFLGEFTPEKKSKICNRNLLILKIDPGFFSFKLLAASEHGGKPRTAQQWSDEFNLIAAINASMYQGTDPLKSTGYMRNYGHVNNSFINKRFGSFMVFNPKTPSLAPVRIVDMRLQKNWRDIIASYNSVIQNYRMISAGEKRGWPQRDQIYSTAAVGMDRDGNCLFIMSRSPYSTHDLIHILLSLPIQIISAMYVEGGPEATLSFTKNGRRLTFMGICEDPADIYSTFHKPPNMIGISRIK